MKSPSPLQSLNTRVALASLPLLALVACAAAPAPVAPPAPEPKADRGPVSMESEIGGMNQEAVEKRFTSLSQPILECVAEGAGRVKEMGGHFALSLRIDRDGHVKTAFLNESTLGDRATELCVLDVARKADWPKPLGGEGLAQRAFDVDAGVEPIAWKPEKIRGALRPLADKVAHCRRGISGRFVTTAYVKPNGSVAAVGVAPPAAEHDDAVECMVAAVKKAKFGSPGRRAAKVTFEL